jgi:hypothetical protein
VWILQCKNEAPRIWSFGFGFFELGSNLCGGRSHTPPATFQQWVRHSAGYGAQIAGRSKGPCMFYLHVLPLDQSAASLRCKYSPPATYLLGRLSFGVIHAPPLHAGDRYATYTTHLCFYNQVYSIAWSHSVTMAPSGEVTLPATRRTRKSIGGQSPTKKTSDKENATIDMGTTLAANRKKSRSKSIGPGGLDVLKPGAGNRRVVRLPWSRDNNAPDLY